MPDETKTAAAPEAAPDAAVAVNLQHLRVLLAEVDAAVKTLGEKGAKLAAARAHLKL